MSVSERKTDPIRFRMFLDAFLFEVVAVDKIEADYE